MSLDTSKFPAYLLTQEYSCQGALSADSTTLPHPSFAQKVCYGCRSAMEGALVTALLAAVSLFRLAAAQTMTPPDPAVFAPVQTAGASGTGFPAFYVGCIDNGATLQDLTVYANDNFLRGIEVGKCASCPFFHDRYLRPCLEQQPQVF